MNTNLMENEFKLALSIPEFSDATSLGKTGIYDAIKNGKLKARKSGKRTIIEVQDGIDFIKSLPLIE